MLNILKRFRFAFLLAALAAVCVACLLLFIPSEQTASADENTDAHTHDGWTELTAGGTLSDGNYYLNGGVTGNLTINGTVTLCLNGHVLRGNGDGSVITVNSGNFTLCDCHYGDEAVSNVVDGTTYHSGVITGGGTTWGGGGVYVSGGAFTMNGGTIAGNSASYNGGGVYLYEGSFVMEGGTIAGNSATSSTGQGGGVFVSDTFTMNGGNIEDNTAYQGGGVFASGTFTMNGGNIDGNTAGERGGGVVVGYENTFIMNGGVISGNSVTDNYADGGGVSVSGGTFIMNSGTVTGNVASDEGGGVNLLYGTFIMNGGYFGANTINNRVNSGTVNISGGYFASCDTVSSYLTSGDYTTLQVSPEGSGYPYAVVPGDYATAHTHADETGVEYNVLAYTGGELAEGNYYLPADTTLADNLTINGNVTICLNGHVLRGNGNGTVITVNSGGSLTLCDCCDGASGVSNTVEINGENVICNSGVITGGNAANGGGIYVDGGSFVMEGGAITGNSARTRGGGLYVSKSEFNMSGGEVSYNDANNGGALYTGSSAQVVLSGGIFTQNVVHLAGGGIYMYGSSHVTIDGDFAITNNRAEGTGGGKTLGGAVMIYNSSVLTVSGGEISGNVSNDGGNGVNVSYGTLEMSGGYIADTFGFDENNADAYITGGYFADADIIDENWFADAEGNSYAVIDISADEDHFGDAGYKDGCSYAVYATGDTSGYGAADIETTYGSDITPSISGNNYNVSISYTYAGTTAGGSPVNGEGLPKNAGKYTVTATFAAYTDGANKTHYPESEVKFAVDIAKATYNMSGVTFEDATFVYSGWIIEMNVGVSTDGGVPDGVSVTYLNNGHADAGVYIVTAVFSGDYENYNEIEPMTATLTIEKATPYYTLPEGITITAGQNLSEIALPAGWAWADGSQVVGEAGEYTFTAVYTPSDANNYLTVTEEITVEVVEAEYTGLPVWAIVLISAGGAAVLAAGIAVAAVRICKRKI